MTQQFDCSIEKLMWAEFERLIALYFRDHGYEVEETGFGWSDGGADLTVTHKHTKERTAEQAKDWDHRRPVGPEINRALHSSPMNPTPACHFAMLGTSSDVSPQARKEAQEPHIEYWHGAMLEHKLERWPKWKGKSSRSSIR